MPTVQAGGASVGEELAVAAGRGRGGSGPAARKRGWDCLKREGVRKSGVRDRNGTGRTRPALKRRGDGATGPTPRFSLSTTTSTHYHLMGSIRCVPHSLVFLVRIQPLRRRTFFCTHTSPFGLPLALSRDSGGGRLYGLSLPSRPEAIRKSTRTSPIQGRKEHLPISLPISLRYRYSLTRLEQGRIPRRTL